MPRSMFYVVDVPFGWFTSGSEYHKRVPCESSGSGGYAFRPGGTMNFNVMFGKRSFVGIGEKPPKE